MLQPDDGDAGCRQLGREGGKVTRVRATAGPVAEHKRRLRVGRRIDE
jgi:hypothetical protein